MLNANATAPIINDEINELRTIISDLQDDEVAQVSPGVSSIDLKYT